MLSKFSLICLMMIAPMAFAQTNTIESVTANQQGSNVIVKIGLSKAVDSAPVSFAISDTAKIVLDFKDIKNGTGKTTTDFNLGDLRSVSIAEANGRSRLVLNLKKSLNYATAIEGNFVLITVDGSGGVATAVNSLGLPAVTAKVASGKQNLKDIDFRRGADGEGRVVIDLPSNQVAVDIQQQGQKIIVDFLKVGVPEVLKRRLDVADYGTPVQIITTKPYDNGTRMEIEPKGMWEHSAYQSDTQLVIEVRPIKEDPNKLTQGTQGYRGEKIGFNIQDVDVRAVLQIIAEVSGFNVIASDSVTGRITLRLKDVPWDQALDIIMQSKGLDMRKNGQVIWVAPKDELLTKERSELEQKAKIAELEPMRTESFQLNYQKAEAFKTIFGLDAGGGGGGGGAGGGGATQNRMLSARGSAVIDARTNQIFVTDIASKLEEVRKLVQKVDIASKQVLIEARIVEADDSFSKNLGAKLGFADLRNARGGDTGYQVSGNQRIALTGNYLGVGEQTGQAAITDKSFIPNTQFVSLPADSIGGVTPGSLAISLFSSAANRFVNLELSALEADGRGKIVSSPRVVTADQLPAHIEQGTEIPYLITSPNGATSIQFRKATLSLDVTPQITPDGNVILTVDVHKDSPGAQTTGGLSINTKQVKTMVLVENGGTVVLGGIYYQEQREDVSKVPFLGDIPLIGNLFKKTDKTNNKTELLVFITPKVIAEHLTTR